MMQFQKKKTKYSKDEGYILPIIIIISLVLTVIGLSTLQTLTTVRRTLTDDYYQRVADLAAEAGAQYAEYCFRKGNDSQTWPVGSPLLPESTCDGTKLTPIAQGLRYVMNSGDACSRFEVSDVSAPAGGLATVQVTGYAERRTGSVSNVCSDHPSVVVREVYTRKLNNAMRPSIVNFSNLQVGYTFFYQPAKFADLATPGVFNLYERKPNVFYATIGTDGYIRTAGGNRFGVLGTGASGDRYTPGKVQIGAGNKRVKEIYTNNSGFGDTLFVLTTDGEVYGMGRNDAGQLGNGTPHPVDSYHLPLKMNLPVGETVKDIATYSVFTAVLMESGRVYTVGSCRDESLGLGSGPSQLCVDPGPPIPDPDGPGPQIAYPWPNEDGIVTNLNMVNGRGELPSVNPANPNTIIKDIIVDDRGTYVTMNGGSAYAWGHFGYGAVGRDVFYLRPKTPVALQYKDPVGGTLRNFGDGTGSNIKAEQIITNTWTTYVIDQDGKVWASGHNNFGEAGGLAMSVPPQDINSTINVYTGLQDKHVKQFRQVEYGDADCRSAKMVKGYTDHSYSVAFLTDNGAVCVMGRSDKGAFGLPYGNVHGSVPAGTYADQGYRRITLPGSVTAVDFALSYAGPPADNGAYDTLYIVGNNGMVYAMGSNTMGELGRELDPVAGNSATLMSNSLQPMSVIDGVNIKAKEVRAAYGSVIIMAEGGKVYTVGSNQFGQLGNGKTPAEMPYSNIPVEATFMMPTGRTFLY